MNIMKIYIVDIDGTICNQVTSADGSIDYNKAQPIKERIKKSTISLKKEMQFIIGQ